MAVRLVVTFHAAPGKGAELAQAMKARCEISRQDAGCELGPGSSVRPGAGSTDPQSVSVTAAPSRCPRKQSEHACRQLNCCNVLFGGYEPIRRSVSHE